MCSPKPLLNICDISVWPPLFCPSPTALFILSNHVAHWCWCKPVSTPLDGPALVWCCICWMPHCVLYSVQQQCCGYCPQHSSSVQKGFRGNSHLHRVQSGNMEHSWCEVVRVNCVDALSALCSVLTFQRREDQMACVCSGLFWCCLWLCWRLFSEVH